MELLLNGFSVVLPVLRLEVLYRLVSRKEASQDRGRKLLHWM
ncbi:MAG: hypothetical protein PVF08_08170 [Gammaproteobacteria bacterium]|jgi:hypothetical protein